MTRILRELREALRDGGLRGSFLVRDLDTGDEVGLDPDAEFPIASLVKVPLAIATLERAARGELDVATPVNVLPGRVTVAGPTGLSRFRPRWRSRTCCTSACRSATTPRRTSCSP